MSKQRTLMMVAAVVMAAVAAMAAVVVSAEAGESGYSPATYGNVARAAPAPKHHAVSHVYHPSKAEESKRDEANKAAAAAAASSNFFYSSSASESSGLKSAGFRTFSPNSGLKNPFAAVQRVSEDDDTGLVGEAQCMQSCDTHEFCLDTCDAASGGDCCPVCAVESTSDIHTVADAQGVAAVCVTCEDFMSQIYCDFPGDCECDASGDGLCAVCGNNWVCHPEEFRCVSPESLGTDPTPTTVECPDGFRTYDFNSDAAGTAIAADGTPLSNSFLGFSVRGEACTAEPNSSPRGVLAFPSSTTAGELGTPNNECDGCGTTDCPGISSDATNFAGQGGAGENCDDQGNVLIVGRDCLPTDATCELADEKRIADLFIDFNTARAVNSIAVLDITTAGGFIAGFSDDASPVGLFRVDLAPLGSNTLQTIRVPSVTLTGEPVLVKTLQIHFPTNGGAVANLCAETVASDDMSDNLDPITDPDFVTMARQIPVCVSVSNDVSPYEVRYVDATETCGCVGDFPQNCKACQRGSWYGSFSKAAVPLPGFCGVACGLPPRGMDNPNMVASTVETCEPDGDGETCTSVHTCPFVADESEKACDRFNSCCCHIKKQLVCWKSETMAQTCASRFSDDPFGDGGVTEVHVPLEDSEDGANRAGHEAGSDESLGISDGDDDADAASAAGGSGGLPASAVAALAGVVAAFALTLVAGWFVVGRRRKARQEAAAARAAASAAAPAAAAAAAPSVPSRAAKNAPVVPPRK